jgi:hypothetical protein
VFFSWFFKLPPRATFLALGDSILSDDYPGPHRGAASLVYRNLDRDFSEFQGRDLASRGDNDFVNLTKSGYQLPDVEKSLLGLQDNVAVHWLLLSVGGNDLLAGDSHPERFERDYAAFVTGLRERFPYARLAIVNAYDPTDGTGLVESSRARGLEPRPQLLEGLEWLNGVIARQAQLALVDIYSHFRGHPDWFQRDIEPNGKGASEVRRQVYGKLVSA